MDIVERLRANYSDTDSGGAAHMALEAADEIDRLREALDKIAHMEPACRGRGKMTDMLSLARNESAYISRNGTRPTSGSRCIDALVAEIEALSRFLEIALDAHDDHFGKTNAEKYPKNWDVQARRRLAALKTAEGTEP